MIFYKECDNDEKVPQGGNDEEEKNDHTYYRSANFNVISNTPKCPIGDVVRAEDTIFTVNSISVSFIEKFPDPDPDILSLTVKYTNS